MKTLPTLYISHGSPMTAIEPGPAGAFQQRLGPAIEATFGRPRAVLAWSAHTLARAPILLAAARHETVHDFYGFPPELYQLRYDAAGAPDLADEVQALLAAAGMPVQRSPEGGLDHGIWTPLRYMFPDASIPVLPLAFVPTWTPAQLHAFGQALAPLAERGVLMLGSGSLTHNLHMVFGEGRPTFGAAEVPQSAAFRTWVHERASQAEWTAMFDYRTLAPYAAQMHPTDEHWLPWYLAGGAAGANAQGLRLHDSLTYGCLGMDVYAFGPQAEALARALQP